MRKTAHGCEEYTLKEETNIPFRLCVRPRGKRQTTTIDSSETESDHSSQTLRLVFLKHPEESSLWGMVPSVASSSQPQLDFGSASFALIYEALRQAAWETILPHDLKTDASSAEENLKVFFSTKTYCLPPWWLHHPSFYFSDENAWLSLTHVILLVYQRCSSANETPLNMQVSPNWKL